MVVKKPVVVKKPIEKKLEGFFTKYGLRDELSLYTIVGIAIVFFFIGMLIGHPNFIHLEQAERDSLQRGYASQVASLEKTQQKEIQKIVDQYSETNQNLIQQNQDCLAQFADLNSAVNKINFDLNKAISKMGFDLNKAIYDLNKHN